MKPSRFAVASVLLFGVAAVGCGGRSGLKSADGGRVADARPGDGRTPDGGVIPSTDGPRTDVPIPSGDGPIGPDVPGNVMLTGVGVTPALFTAGIGTIVPYTATGRFSDGSTRDLTAQAAWTSSAPMIASMAGSAATGRSAGTATITATVMGRSGAATLTVTAAPLTGMIIEPVESTVPIGMTVPLRAFGLYADGRRQELTAQSVWMSTDPSTATVEAGVVAGLRAGGVTIVATFQNQGAKASVRVTMATLNSIEIAPLSPTLPVLTTQPFTAMAFYSDGTRGDVTAAVKWASSDQGVLVFGPQGLAMTSMPGTAVVSATLGNVATSTVVMVSPARLTAIRVEPVGASTPLGTTVGFTARGAFSDGSNAVITTAVAWSSSNERIATISNAPGSQGLATALSPGGVGITATLQGVTGVARLQVTEAKVVGLAITPDALGVGVGATQSLRAVASFSDGSQKDVTEQTSWLVADALVAAVSNGGGTAGQVTGVRTGSTTVTGNYQGLTDTTQVTVNDSVLKAVTISPQTLNLAAGTRQAATATGEYSDGSMADITAQVTWTIDNVMVATVSNAAGASGMVVGISEGQTALLAQLGPIQAKALVIVTAVIAQQLSVSPVAASIRIGQSTLFGASLIRSNGTSQNVTTASQWTSSNPMVASLGNGMFGASRATCQSVGTTTITATFMGISDSTVLTCTEMRTLVDVQVTPFAQSLSVGQMFGFTATALYSDNSTQNVTGQTTWVSSNPMVAPVRNMGGMGGRGTVSALSAGSVTITGTYMGISASGFVTVTDATLTGLSVSPVSLALRVGEMQGLQATALYSDGTTRNVTGMTVWASSDQMVADVTNTAMGGGRGQVTALAAGTTTIIATFMGFQGTTSVSVTSPTLTSIQVSPINGTQPKASVVQYQAVALYSDSTSRMVTGQAIWGSSNGAVAAVSNAGGSRGLVTTLAAGTTQISAAFGGMTGQTALTVTAATVMQVQVTPTNPSIPLTTTQPFQAVAIYSDFTSQNVTGAAGWSSSDPAIAQVSNAGGRGQATGLAAGTVTISATFMGVTGSTMLTVSSATVKEIQVSPTNPSSPAGVAIRFDAVAILSDNSSRDVTGMATWTSSDNAIVALSNAGGSRGLATAVGAGAATVTATLGGVSGTTTYTVGSQALTDIIVGPAMLTLKPGAISGLSATGSYSDGSMYELTGDVTWISTMPGIATVSNATGSKGLATGVSPGSTAIQAHFQGKSGSAPLTVVP